VNVKKILTKLFNQNIINNLCNHYVLGVALYYNS